MKITEVLVWPARLARRATTSRSAVAAMLIVVAGCHQIRGDVPSPDIESVKRSAHNVYRATVRPSSMPIPVHRLQSWTLHVETSEGLPVDAATITVNGGMPQHGHGLPTAPRVTRAAGTGEYLVEGVKFNMGGWWVVRFAIASGAGTDTVTFNLSL